MSNETVKKKPRGKAFEKGKSGNPRGRPLGSRSLSSVLRDTINEIDPHTGKRRYDLINARMAKIAQEGDMKAISLIYERIDGKVKEHFVSEVIGAVGTVAIDGKTNKDIVEALKHSLRSQLNSHAKSNAESSETSDRESE